MEMQCRHIVVLLYGHIIQGFFGKWAQSTNFFSSLAYEIVNGANLTAQMLYRSPSNRLNLDGSSSSVDQRVLGLPSQQEVFLALQAEVD